MLGMYCAVYSACSVRSGIHVQCCIYKHTVSTCWYLVYTVQCINALWFNRVTGSMPEIQCFLGLYLRFYEIVDKTKINLFKSSKFQGRSRKQFKS